MYIILETQTNNSVTAVAPLQTEDDYNRALSCWHSICAVASVSSVEQHVVTLLHHNGNVIESKEFRHGVEE